MNNASGVRLAFVLAGNELASRNRSDRRRAGARVRLSPSYR